MSKLEPYFTETQFNNFAGESSHLSSLAEYFQEFITKKHPQARNNTGRGDIETLQIKETARKYGKKGTENKALLNANAKDLPQISSLTSEDQKTFVDEYENTVLHTGLGMNSEKAKHIQEMKPKILLEQQDFQRFVYQHARENAEHYNFVYPEAKTILKVKQDSPETRRIQMYPQYYMLQKTAGLNVGAHYPSDPVLEFTKNIKQVGDVPLISFPNGTKKWDLSGDTHTQTKMTSTPRLSDDPITVQLAKEHRVDIVLTSSALQTLIDNQAPSYLQCWDVPVVVKDFKGRTEDCNKIVFIEKPFPKKELTPPELNSKCYKRCLKRALLSSGQNEMETETDTFEKSSRGCSETSKRANELSGKNYAYSLWKLGKFKILIRARIDAYRKEDSQNEHGVYLSLAVKPEYLSQFGNERLNASETARFWIKTFVRPATSLLCARIDVSTNGIIRLDELKPADVLASGTVFDPASGIKLLFNFFKTFVDLFDGCYLLSHNSKALHCCLYKGITSKITLSSRKPEVDLFARYSKDSSIRSFQSSDIPFNGIDVHMFSATHIQERRIPGMFPPVSAEVLREIEERRRREQEQLMRLHNPNKRKDAQRRHGQWKKKKNKKKKRAGPANIAVDKSQLNPRQNKRMENVASHYKDLDSNRIDL